MDKQTFDDLFRRYTAAVTATDVDGIVGLYAPDASIQNPVGGPVREGIDAFYRENELDESLAVVGPACVAGLEAAVPMLARVRHGGVLLEIDVIDVIDVARIDEKGRVVSMRAFFDLEGGRCSNRASSSERAAVEGEPRAQSVLKSGMKRPAGAPASTGRSMAVTWALASEAR